MTPEHEKGYLDKVVRLLDSGDVSPDEVIYEAAVSYGANRNPLGHIAIPADFTPNDYKHLVLEAHRRLVERGQEQDR